MKAELSQFSNSTSADSTRRTMTPERRALLIELLEEFRAEQRESARKADCTVFAGRVDAHFALNSERSAAGIVFRLREGK